MKEASEGITPQVTLIGSGIEESSYTFRWNSVLERTGLRHNNRVHS